MTTWRIGVSVASGVGLAIELGEADRVSVAVAVGSMIAMAGISAARSTAGVGSDASVGLHDGISRKRTRRILQDLRNCITEINLENTQVQSIVLSLSTLVERLARRCTG